MLGRSYHFDSKVERAKRRRRTVDRDKNLWNGTFSHWPLAWYSLFYEDRPSSFDHSFATITKSDHVSQA
jgi:hypothetical protein